MVVLNQCLNHRQIRSNHSDSPDRMVLIRTLDPATMHHYLLQDGEEAPLLR